MKVGLASSSMLVLAGWALLRNHGPLIQLSPAGKLPYLPNRNKAFFILKTTMWTGCLTLIPRRPCMFTRLCDRTWECGRAQAGRHRYSRALGVQFFEWDQQQQNVLFLVSSLCVCVCVTSMQRECPPCLASVCVCTHKSHARGTYFLLFTFSHCLKVGLNE